MMSLERKKISKNFKILSIDHIAVATKNTGILKSFFINIMGMNFNEKEYVKDAIKLIAEENPELSASELGMIKSTLIAQKSIDGITSKINNLTKLNSNVKLKISSLKTLTNQAKNIKETIKNKAMGFIQGHISAGISAVKSFFRF